MASIKELLELRNRIKSKKPDFIRQDTRKKKRLEKKWRRPKGLHSKIRANLRGKAKKVSQGYRSPRKVRHLHKSGLQQSIVKSIRDLEKLDAKKNCLIISSSLGNKKKIVILKKAKDLGFNILNIKNPDGYIRKVEDRISLRKEAKKEKKVGKVVKKEKLVKKEKEEYNKEMGKMEKDKLLTRKEK